MLVILYVFSRNNLFFTRVAIPKSKSFNWNLVVNPMFPGCKSVWISVLHSYLEKCFLVCACSEYSYLYGWSSQRGSGLLGGIAERRPAGGRYLWPARAGEYLFFSLSRPIRCPRPVHRALYISDRYGWRLGWYECEHIFPLEYLPIKGSAEDIRDPKIAIMLWCFILVSSWISFKIALFEFSSVVAFLITNTGQNGTLAVKTSDLLVRERIFFTLKLFRFIVVDTFTRSVSMYEGIRYCDFSACALKLSESVWYVEVDWKETVKSM